MSVRAATVRWSFLVGLVGLLAAGRADAQTTCNSDKDCPGTACGGQVCMKSSGLSMCVDANTAGASGINDGWCTDPNGNPVDSNCKCASFGATCSGFYCSFTIPPDGGVSGTAGSTGSGGSGAAGASGTGSAGTSGGSGGGGGCSVGGAPSAGGGAGLALLALALLRRRASRA